MFSRSLAMFAAALALSFVSATAAADEYADARSVFRKAGESGKFFDKSYGYALFPTIGKGGVVVGGAYGEGRVFQGGKYVGDASMTQLSAGFQLGGQAYSMIIFFENEKAFREFTKGEYAFGANAQATAITASASATASTTGSTAGASVTKKKAETAGAYQNGMALFTVAKGGLMYEASLSGAKFSYKKK